ncbi:MAG: MMPL family transporter, partial [Treponema sp.]|nr:MMPL family transporter [Treponema sp.]
LYSGDFTATQILIPLTISSEEAGNREITDQIMHIRNLARETFAGSASVYVTGMPVIAATVNEAMIADLKVLVPAVIVVVLLALFFSFRRLAPVILPLLTVIMTIIWTVGAMPLFGVKLSVISTVLPVILVAVGIGESIHILNYYLNAAKNKHGSINREEHFELVLAVMMKMRRSVFLTAITTFAGFISFSFTSVAPCREFGYFSSFGVAAAFVITLTLIPALLIIVGPRLVSRQTQKEKTKENNNLESGGFSGFLAGNLFIIAQHKKTVVFLAVVAIAFSVYGVSKLIIDNIMIEYFRHDTDIYQSDEFIRRQFGGSKVISVVITAESEKIILRPDTLAAMDGLSVFLQRKIPNTGKVMSFTDLVKRINQVFNADENPDGLRVTTVSPVNNAANTADFGFGFGDFGFDDYSSAAESGKSTVDNSGVDREKIYTQNELIDLFDRAGSNFRGMNANDLIWELKRQVNYEGAAYYEIPLEPKRYGKQTLLELQGLIANYLVLLSGNISNYANDPLEPTAIKATVQLRTLGMEDSYAIFREIEQYAAANFPDDVTVTMGGTTMVEDSLNSRIVQSQIISIVFSVFSIFLIIAIANKSLPAGLIAMAPLSISILLNFAIMGLAGIKLNLGTSMVGAVAICVGIDYTIHCIEAYKREYSAASGGDFLRRVFLSSGKAIVINATAVGLSFSVMMLSSFTMLADFGMLIAFTMFSSALVSLTVLPVLLSLIKPKFIYN